VSEGEREGSGPGVDDGPAYPDEPRERLRVEVTSSVDLSSKEIAERGSQSAWWSGLEAYNRGEPTYFSLPHTRTSDHPSHWLQRKELCLCSQ
jgi:hypothetical protein